MSDVTRHDGLEAVTPTEAAQRLGITPDAVRARLRRGTLPGEQRGHEWTVYLPPEPLGTDGPNGEDQRDADTTHRATRHDADTTAAAALIAAKDETIGRLDADVAYLREQLDHSRRELSAERERFDVIHREALQRIEALTAGTEGSDREPNGSGAPIASPDAPGRDVPDEGLRTPEHAPSWLLAAWQRLRGRS